MTVVVTNDYDSPNGYPYNGNSQQKCSSLFGNGISHSQPSRGILTVRVIMLKGTANSLWGVMRTLELYKTWEWRGWGMLC